MCKRPFLCSFIGNEIVDGDESLQLPGSRYTRAPRRIGVHLLPTTAMVKSLLIDDDVNDYKPS